MAVDKLVDSSQLNSDLTSVANAIRTKGGTSAQLAFPAGFVSAIEAIPTGGGSSVPPWITNTETITIGANNITNMADAKNYFSSYEPYAFVFLKTTPDTYNQAVGIFGLTANVGLRHRNGTIGTVSCATSYDGKLIEGTQYEVWSL